MFDGPQFGGIAKSNLDLANEFIKQGHIVTLIIKSADGPRKLQINAEAKFCILGNKRAVGIVLSLCGFFVKERPDLIIVSNLMPGLLAQIARLFCFSKVNLAVVSHINVFRNLKDRDFPLRKKIFLKYLVPHLLTKQVKVISLTEQARDGIAKILRRNIDDIQVIYNPIVVSDDNRANFLSEINWWEDSGLKIIVLGRIDPLKDIPTVLRAVALINDLNPKVLVVGEGPSRAALEDLSFELGVDSSVKFIGFIPNPSLLLSHANILVSASLSEALPLNLAEALTVGVQVVAADCDFGPREILGDNEWGLLIPLQDSSAMADGIRRVHDNPFPLKLLKNRAADFNSDRIAKKFLELFY